MNELVVVRHLNRRLLGNKSRVGDSWLLVHFLIAYTCICTLVKQVFQGGVVEIKKRNLYCGICNRQMPAADKHLFRLTNK